MRRSEGRFPETAISEHVRLIDSSTSVKAQTLFVRGRTWSVYELVLLPACGFFRTFIVEKKILEGIRGLIASALASYEEFVTRLKLWELEHVKRDDGN